jgi:penicillinase repressor
MVQGDADDELNRDVERAMALLGPLEGRVMRAVWTGEVAETFVVRDVQALMPKLAYTTVMTTLRRLADKGLLTARASLAAAPTNIVPLAPPLITWCGPATTRPHSSSPATVTPRCPLSPPGWPT